MTFSKVTEVPSILNQRLVINVHLQLCVLQWLDLETPISLLVSTIGLSLCIANVQLDIISLLNQAGCCGSGTAVGVSYFCKYKNF